MNKKIVITFTLISILITLSACGGTGVLTYNKPTSPKPTYKSPLFDDTHPALFASINLEQIDMAIRGDYDTDTVAVGPLFLTVIPWPPGIYRLIFNGDRTTDPPLPLEIRLAPKAGSIVFNAMKVFLVFDNGQRLQPKARFLIGSLTSLKLLGVGSGTRYCNSPEIIDLQVMDKDISITEPSCVRLEYDAPVVPKEPFTVFIEGVSETGQRIEVPPIRFERRSLFDLYSIP